MTRTRTRVRRPQRPKPRYPSTERALYILMYEQQSDKDQENGGK